MKLTDAAVAKAAWVIAEGNSRAWLTYSDDTRAFIARSWEPTARAAITTALPHLTDDGAAATPPADKGVWCAPAAESATPVGAGAAAPSSPHPTYSEIKDAIRTGLGVRGRVDGCGCESHICSAADGVQALFGEGATPAIDRAALTELLRFNRHAPYVSNERLADMVAALIEGAS